MCVVLGVAGKRVTGRNRGKNVPSRMEGLRLGNRMESWAWARSGRAVRLGERFHSELGGVGATV